MKKYRCHGDRLKSWINVEGVGLWKKAASQKQLHVTFIDDIEAALQRVEALFFCGKFEVAKKNLWH